MKRAAPLRPAPRSNLDCTKLTGTLGGKLGDSLPLYTCLSSL